MLCFYCLSTRGTANAPISVFGLCTISLSLSLSLFRAYRCEAARSAGPSAVLRAEVFVRHRYTACATKDRESEPGSRVPSLFRPPPPRSVPPTRRLRRSPAPLSASYSAVSRPVQLLRRTAGLLTGTPPPWTPLRHQTHCPSSRPPLTVTRRRSRMSGALAS